MWNSRTVYIIGFFFYFSFNFFFIIIIIIFIIFLFLSFANLILDDENLAK